MLGVQKGSQMVMGCNDLTLAGVAGVAAEFRNQLLMQLIPFSFKCPTVQNKINVATYSRSITKQVTASAAMTLAVLMSSLEKIKQRKKN